MHVDSREARDVRFATGLIVKVLYRTQTRGTVIFKQRSKMNWSLIQLQMNEILFGDDPDYKPSAYCCLLATFLHRRWGTMGFQGWMSEPSNDRTWYWDRQQEKYALLDEKTWRDRHAKYVNRLNNDPRVRGIYPEPKPAKPENPIAAAIRKKLDESKEVGEEA